MHDNTRGGCHKLPEGKHGDVGPNGDLVNRLRAATGECVGSIDREAHVLAVASEILRVKHARAGARAA